jgi:hypothetical protein
MNRRPYRGAQSLHERLSDEFHRNGKLHKADQSRFGPQAPMNSSSGDDQRQRAHEMASQAADELADKSSKSDSPGHSQASFDRGAERISRSSTRSNDETIGQQTFDAPGTCLMEQRRVAGT